MILILFAGWSGLEFDMTGCGRQCPLGGQSNSGQSAKSYNGSGSSSANEGSRFTSLPSVIVDCYSSYMLHGYLSTNSWSVAPAAR